MASPVGPEPASQAPRTKRSRGLVFLVVLAAVALVAVPVLVAEVPRERARWLAAEAVENYLDGRLAEALSQLDEAIERTPDYREGIALRAEWRRQDKDFAGSLADYRELLELHPKSIALLIQEDGTVIKHRGLCVLPGNEQTFDELSHCPSR